MKKIYVIGAGGLGREVIRYITDINNIRLTYDISGFIDEADNKAGTICDGYPVYSFSDLTKDVSGDLCVCAVASPDAKMHLVSKAKEKGLLFQNIIHPLAYISYNLTALEDVIIGPYCCIGPNVSLCNHVCINPQCGIGHDSMIGDYSTLYWNVSIGGNVNIGMSCQIGSKAFIKQGITLGSYSTVGAGAVVVKNVEENSTVTGIPAKELKEENI